MLHRKKNLGIGLLELMLSLAIIAALLLMATRYYREADESLKVTRSIKNIHTLVDASFKWVEGHYNFADNPPISGSASQPISVNSLIASGLLPSTWQNKKDPWAVGKPKLIEVTPYNPSGSSGYKHIRIHLPYAPMAACNSLNDSLSKQGMTLIMTCSNNSGYDAYYPASK